MTMYEIYKRLRPGKIIIIKPTLRCNLYCDYCSIIQTTGQRPEFSEISWQKWMDIIESYSQKYSRIKEIVISGGEPFLYKDIVELINSLLTRWHLISIATNLTTTRGLEINPSKRIKIRATYHEKCKLSKFKQNLESYKQKFPYVYVKEFEETYPSIRGSRIRQKKFLNPEREKEAICFAPNGEQFSSLTQMERAGCKDLSKK